MSLGTNIVLTVAFYMNSNKLVYLKSTVIVIYIYIYVNKKLAYLSRNTNVLMKV